MGLFSRRARKPQTDRQVLMDALAGVKQREDLKHRLMARKMGGGGWRRFLDTRILVGLLVILIALLADAVRRENQEFQATLTEMWGQVFVQQRAGSAQLPAELNQILADGAILSTAARSSATLSFPDGSLLVVGPESHLTVNLLEYSRGGAWRMRAFYLKTGQLWAKVSPHFGAKSELKIYTASSVAAVRGTVFSVSQSRAGDRSQIACAEGAVYAAGFRGVPLMLATGYHSEVQRGEAVPRPQRIGREHQQSFMQYVLWTPPPDASRLQKLEFALTQLLHAPMTILGIGKCGWAFGALDVTRRSAAMEALRRLQIHLEGAPQYPPYINPVTLEELGVPLEFRDQILNNLHGRALLRYEALSGGRDYLIYARARDNRRTLFRLTAVGVRAASPEEEERIF